MRRVERGIVQLVVLLVAVLSITGACNNGNENCPSTSQNCVTLDAAIDGRVSPIDAASSRLGTVCDPTEPNDCGPAAECVVLDDIGSTTEGFCTVPCGGLGDTATCANGYDGPGTPACWLENAAEELICTIGCGLPSECPDGLSCFDGTCAVEQVNTLGIACHSDTNPCPHGGQCIVLAGLGSQENGFCTIGCDGQADGITCQRGYMFVGQGEPACRAEFENDPNRKACLVMNCSLDDESSCPPGLMCVAPTAGTRICVGAD